MGRAVVQLTHLELHELTHWALEDENPHIKGSDHSARWATTYADVMNHMMRWDLIAHASTEPESAAVAGD